MGSGEKTRRNGESNWEAVAIAKDADGGDWGCSDYEDESVKGEVDAGFTWTWCLGGCWLRERKVQQSESKSFPELETLEDEQV